jgi:CDP-2,3-bis-(O-geranylgeranyl)-sn-glycerol synthase
MHIQIISELVLLLVIANGAPVFSAMLLGKRLNRPLDGNLRFLDGHPLLGPAKTLRGLLSAILVTSLVAPLFGLAPAQGAAFGLLAMLGDLTSSFLKRRLGVTPSHSAPLLDQLPETLLPLLVMRPVLAASITEILVAALVFVVIDLLLSWLRDKWSF